MTKDDLVLPQYWQKRRKKLKPSLIQTLVDSLNSKPLVTDDYGEYRVGTFLYEACIITVKQEAGLWAVQILSQQYVSTHLIQVIRYKFIPNDATMIQLYPSREMREDEKGICLYELPKE